jgi:non-ribosomal peptide synthetase component F
MVVAAAIGDQVADRADLQVMELRKGDEVIHPRHGPIFVHDLADHARGVQARQPRDIHRRLGVAGAHQHAAVARDQREDMARRDQRVGAVARIDRHRDGPCAVGRRDAGGHAFLRLDRDGEGGFVPGAVLGAHQRQAERVDPFARHRQADQPAPVPRHEVDLLRRCHLRGDDQIAFIFAILIIDQDEHAAVARLVDDLFGAGQETAPQTGKRVGISGHDNAPCAVDNGRARRSRY